MTLGHRIGIRLPLARSSFETASAATTTSPDRSLVRSKARGFSFRFPNIMAWSSRDLSSRDAADTFSNADCGLNRSERQIIPRLEILRHAYFARAFKAVISISSCKIPLLPEKRKQSLGDKRLPPRNLSCTAFFNEIDSSNRTVHRLLSAIPFCARGLPRTRGCERRHHDDISKDNEGNISRRR